jgi:phosphatidate cytidylyltransferase
MPVEAGGLEAWVRMPDLLPRVMTATVLIILVFAGVFFLSPLYFSLISGIVFLGAASEWAKLSGFFNKWVYIVLVFFSLIGVFYLPANEILLAGVILWGFAILNFFRYFPLFAQIAGVIMLPAAWKAINILCFYPPHPYKLLTLFLIVWLSDTAAYFVGSRFGKHK